ncbi:MAG: dTMP kinase [Rickettsiaceae bacterium]|jgi:dTMP kinase|nr:dTMP kinase [Rickettsiaceae bacterium]
MDKDDFLQEKLVQNTQGKYPSSLEEGVGEREANTAEYEGIFEERRLPMFDAPLNQNTQGIFITFEGGEGSGKTTQSKLLKQYFDEQNIPCIWTREIGGTKSAEQIREIIINNELDVRTEMLLAMAARVEHVEQVIKPALAKGSIVICDRFIDSTAAYQGSALSDELVFNMHEQIFGSFLPSFTFYMQINPRKALERALSRGDINKFEGKPLEFHEIVQESFLKLAEKFPERIIVIDAERTQDIIAEEILEITLERLVTQN